MSQSYIGEPYKESREHSTKNTEKFLIYPQVKENTHSSFVSVQHRRIFSKNFSPSLNHIQILPMQSRENIVQNSFIHWFLSRIGRMNARMKIFIFYRTFVVFFFIKCQKTTQIPPYYTPFTKGSIFLILPNKIINFKSKLMRI